MKYPKQKVGLSEGVVIYLLAIVANLAMQLIIGIVAGVAEAVSGNDKFASDNYVQLISMILLQTSFLAVPLIYYGAVRKKNPVLFAPAEKPSPALAISPLLAVLSIFGFIMPAQLFENFLMRAGYNITEMSQYNIGQFILALFVMVILAPCVEELIFRGFLLSGLKKSFNPYIASLFCALAFSLMHMNPEQTVYQFCLGYVCSLAAIKCGNLLAPIIVHAVSNLMALTCGGVLGKYTEVLSHSALSAALSAAGIAIACGAAIFFLCLAMQKINAVWAKRKVAGTAAAEGDGVGDIASTNDTEASGAQADGAQTDGAEKARKSRRTGMLIYVGGILLCLIMWVFVFVASIM